MIYDTVHITVADTLFISVKTDVENQTIKDRISLYPNPTNDKLFISYNGNNDNLLFIKIIDIKGEELFWSVLSNQTNELSLSNLTSRGLLFVQILDEKSNVVDTRKVVLE